MNPPPRPYTIPELTLPPGDLWVFGYGSVMWRPGFKHAERQAGRVFGYHRSLCVWSWVHRGTQASPGLVLGLDVGGSCLGIAYRVGAADKHDAADYLYRRELVTDGYEAMLHPVHLPRGPVTALCFRANRGHPQYAGKLDHREAAAVVRRATGVSGANPDYVASAVQQLRAMGINDRVLVKINNLVQTDRPYTSRR
ncbi:MAG: gamma-glutamylcyclotransferase [Alphaproteobacteria bacterium]